jgi:hypothetical protein
MIALCAGRSATLSRVVHWKAGQIGDAQAGRGYRDLVLPVAEDDLTVPGATDKNDALKIRHHGARRPDRIR